MGRVVSMVARGAVAEVVFGTADGDERDALVTDPEGRERVVPLFRAASDDAWRLRYSSGLPGEHVARVGGEEQVIVVGEDVAEGARPVRVAGDGRHLEHEDGTPFLWVADTWWLGFVARFAFPGDVEAMITRRASQGFSVVQVVAGLYPELDPFDPLGDGDAPDAGWPWMPGFEAIAPAWWDAADRRLQAIVDGGLVPAVVGAWSYYLLHLGAERMRRHWREIIARWGAYPVVWCVAGEAGLPEYDQLFTPEGRATVEELRAGWRAVAAEVRALDPFDRVMTVHPCPAFRHYSSRDIYDDDDLIDMVWLQTGHAGQSSIEPSLAALQHEVSRAPARPVVNSEVCYEGIGGACWQDLQRFLFWSHMLSGAAGHTYGAQGIWAFREPADHGPGGRWSDVGWREAAELPGGAQVGMGRKILERIAWWRLTPAPGAIDPHWHHGCRTLPYAAAIPGECVIAYLPSIAYLPPALGVSVDLQAITVRGLDPERTWRASAIDPRTGETAWTRAARPDATGAWALASATDVSPLPTFEDWILLVEAS